MKTTVDYYLNDIWHKTLNSAIQAEQIMPDILPYLDGAHLISIEDDKAVVVTTNFVNYSIMAQNSIALETAIRVILQNDNIILILKLETPQKEVVDDKEKKESFVNRFIKTNFNPQFTFDTFVVGRSNIQAQLAALTVATNPGLIYNPLFIYGNSGLGKTHLLSAIGNKIEDMFPSKKIAYISGLDFVEGVYQSSKEKKMDEFKSGFHDLDVLLVDDIQFIAGKEKTHEIFFTVFNDLVNNRKQICLTADRTPNEIKGLEERIISRFNQGLNVNIEAPEYETAVNILKMKINNSISAPKNISEDVISYIANNFAVDVRSLEGALTRLLFYSINFAPNQNITIDVAAAAFQDTIADTKELTIEKIKSFVADYYGLTPNQLSSKSRTKNIATARHIAMYLCRKILDASYSDIGKSFGKRDHSTVINACNTVEEKYKTSPVYAQAVRDIELKINHK